MNVSYEWYHFAFIWLCCIVLFMCGKFVGEGDKPTKNNNIIGGDKRLLGD